jgi:dienelactone hydrolase
MEKVLVVSYPNATHGFDAPGADLIMLGHRIRYQPEAAATATQAVRSFLAEIMR